MKILLIADAFFKGGFIETWGRGIEKICNACKENGNPLPRYEISPNDFTVIFDAVPGTGKDGLIHKTEGGSQLEPGESTFDVVEKVTEKVTENQKKIIEEVRMNPNITQPELSKIIGISVVHIKKNMAKLQARNIIKRIGPDKGGHWEIITR